MENNENFANEIETIIIGAGQAGLSVARYLKEHNKSFLILEKSDSIGSTWKHRYDSLLLDSFAKYSQLEGFPFWGNPMQQMTKNEIVEYLQAFAKHFELHPQYSTEVTSIEKVPARNAFSIADARPHDSLQRVGQAGGDGKFIVNTNKGVYHTNFVVLATGPFQKPYIPKGAENIPQNIYQIHSKDYKNPEQLKDGPTLVVGAGNSGTEIVEELLESGRVVHFSYKRKLKSIKSSRFSQWLAYRLGLAHVPKESLLGKIIIWYTKGKPVGVDVGKLLKNPNLTSVGEFKGEVPKNTSNIIWATGYETDFSIISIQSFNPLTQRRGVTNIGGLYILNIRWQYSKSSSHLAGVSRDAKYIVKHIMDKSQV